MRAVTASEWAAYVGVLSSAVRQSVRRNRIEPIGKRGNALLYCPLDLARAMGTRDRQVA